MSAAAPDRPGPADASALSAYQAAHRSVVLATPALERLFVDGRDALDLLHRLSTNALAALETGEGAATVFTTPKGRILDLVTVHRLDDGLLMLVGERRAQALRDWIDKYTFREQVRVQDWTTSHATFGLFGPRAGSLVERAFRRPAAEMPRHSVVQVPIDGGAGWLVRGFPLAGDGYLVTIPSETAGRLRDMLRRAADEPLLEAGPDCLEVLRIESGLPAAGRELNEEHNPWEARLQDAISLSKGCYVGQEVIARLNTYQKVARQLVRLAVPVRVAPSKARVAPGDAIQSGGETIGAITSAAEVPGGGEVVALGYVRDEDAVAGRDVVVAGGASSAEGTIVGVAR
jgi:tRNA-modifying protein YgfZ